MESIRTQHFKDDILNTVVFLALIPFVASIEEKKGIRSSLVFNRKYVVCYFETRK